MCPRAPKDITHITLTHKHSRVRLHTAEKLIDVDGLVDDFEVLHDSHQRI